MTTSSDAFDASLAARAHAETTARARSAAPGPPLAKCSAGTAASAPAARHRRATSATSASVSSLKRFTATTHRRPNLRVTHRTWCSALAHPRSSVAIGSSSSSSCWSAAAPCARRARTVATRTTQRGGSPPARALMSKFFSPPMSAPKPASVTTKPSSPTSRSASLSATTDELPCAMLANGPQCTRTGVPSSVCMSVGMSASLSKTLIAPVAPRSSTVTKSPAVSRATAIFPRRALRSVESVASARTAMISEATAISKPVSRVMPFSAGPRPISTPRRNRSHVSTHRFHVIVAGSMRSRQSAARSSADKRLASAPTSRLRSTVMSAEKTLAASRRRRCGAARRRAPVALSVTGHNRLKRASSDCVASWKTRASMAAATRLVAATMAWMSPVRCRLKTSIGMTCEYPPPAAPPLTPKIGPCDGCRIVVTTRLWSVAPSACERPIVVVDLPSPRGVGLTPTTTTRLPPAVFSSSSSRCGEPRWSSRRRWTRSKSTLAACRPYESVSSSRRPAARATSTMGSGVVCCEMSMSFGTGSLRSIASRRYVGPAAGILLRLPEEDAGRVSVVPILVLSVVAAAAAAAALTSASSSDGSATSGAAAPTVETRGVGAHSGWTRARARSIVLRRSIATVMGPTPPGTGVMSPATVLAARKSTSPTRR
mmetsp:Transcript_5438/g.22536  ORF Transcript_5438/g.22536 Transcript_5438/m.22536 type:complete len:657 (+) Transcript_5438:826-2796(+)